MLRPRLRFFLYITWSSYAFRVLPGNPAHAPVYHNGVPAVFGGGYPFEGSAVLRSGDTVVLRTVAHTDVDRAAITGDAHAPDDGRFRRLVGFGRFLSRVVIRNRIHQRLMGIAAVHAILRKPGSGLKPLEGSLRLTAKITIRAVPGQVVPQLEQKLLQRLYVRALAALLQGSGSQRVLTCRGIGLCCPAAREHRVTVIHEGQLIPVRPFSGGDLSLGVRNFMALR